MSRLRVIVCLTTKNGASRLKSPLPSREKSNSTSGDVAQPCDVRSSITAGITYVRPYYFEFISHSTIWWRDSDIICPGSPLSQSSRISRESSFPKIFDRRRHWVRLVLSWLLLTLRVLLGILQNLSNLVSRRDYKTPVKARNHQHLTMHSPKRLQSLKDHVVQLATDRRRNVVEAAREKILLVMDWTSMSLQLFSQIMIQLS